MQCQRLLVPDRLGSSQDQTSSLNIWQINPGRTDQVVDAIVGREETTAPTSNAETDHSVPSQDGVLQIYLPSNGICASCNTTNNLRDRRKALEIHVHGDPGGSRHTR
ncbi:hypothetical protein FPOAC1_009489 [Fusarium poae]|uniref:hypothetical protein n=1 Tax=Fusarium poae TaxID=36050 RepID=UPI001CE8110C|nr:hypothetical protein FPOAC1_009489 [Fusarium poae]KAG8670086.1 hypothetical protein FPOAC1_009489 [Fusarium poae]